MVIIKMHLFHLLIKFSSIFCFVQIVMENVTKKDWNTRIKTKKKSFCKIDIWFYVSTFSTQKLHFLLIILFSNNDSYIIKGLHCKAFYGRNFCCIVVSKSVCHQLSLPTLQTRLEPTHVEHITGLNSKVKLHPRCKY